MPPPESLLCQQLLIWGPLPPIPQPLKTNQAPRSRLAGGGKGAVERGVEFTPL